MADEQGEFARYLPYATQLPRPIVGSTGPGRDGMALELRALRRPAGQLPLRSDATDGRLMAGQDWSTWIAAKAIVTAYAKTRGTDYAKAAEYLRGSRLRLDGSKGVQLNFRTWDGQMRMPIMLATHNAVIATAPLDGFLHQTNVLDTLGTDEPEHKCQ